MQRPQQVRVLLCSAASLFALSANGAGRGGGAGCNAGFIHCSPATLTWPP